MAIRRYLAMTGAEFRSCESFPEKPAWMACHFSPYSTGLSNLPTDLPPGSLLILNDRIPIHGHDPERITEQLATVVARFSCDGVLLDLQRTTDDGYLPLTQFLSTALPCPVVLPASCAEGGKTPVFLGPVPHHTSVAEYLAPWSGREIWLDAALDASVLRISDAGCRREPVHDPIPGSPCHQEEKLHCHYRIDLSENSADFLLWRTAEDLDSLLAEAEALGVCSAVSLYQELYAKTAPG